jgi:hypothetical protein
MVLYGGYGLGCGGLLGYAGVPLGYSGLGLGLSAYPYAGKLNLFLVISNLF